MRTWLASLETDVLKEMLEKAATDLNAGQVITSFSSIGTSATFQRTYFSSDMLEAITKELVRRGEVTLYSKPLKTGRILHGI